MKSLVREFMSRHGLTLLDLVKTCRKPHLCGTRFFPSEILKPFEDGFSEALEEIMEIPLDEGLDMSPKRVSDYIRNFNKRCDEAGIYPVIRPGAERRGESYKASNDTWHALRLFRKETRRK